MDTRRPGLQTSTGWLVVALESALFLSPVWRLALVCVSVAAGGIVAVRNVESTSDEQVRSALGSVAGPDVPRIGVIENFVHP